jgi:hypothetical protein
MLPNDGSTRSATVLANPSTSRPLATPLKTVINPQYPSQFFGLIAAQE